jgi:YVTN family beta-propeller protein
MGVRFNRAGSTRSRLAQLLMGVGAAAVGVALLCVGGVSARAGMTRTHEPVGHVVFASPQVDPIVLSPDGKTLFVALTTANLVAVVDTNLNYHFTSVPVGIDPVSLAIRPGTNELWVSNHVSDSVSVIDIGASSPTRYRVIDTIQSMDAQGVTQFDEPVGIAFTADGSKAYVALSSRNQIAVIDASSRTVLRDLNIRAQDPRAIAVRNGVLYVAAFESGNQSQLSACPTGTSPFITGSPPDCTLGALDLINFAQNPNLPGSTKNIVFDTNLPDRDLFTFNTSSDTEISGGVVSGIGTLLYGLAVSSSGRAFITETDARNVVNGLDGQNLIDLGDLMFDNEVAAVTCTTGGCGSATIHNLEPSNPTHATSMATPYGVALSGDDSTLVITLAANSRVATVDASSLATLSTLDLGSGASFGQQIPRGVALLSAPNGAPQTAYVLNTLENTVSVVDVSNPSSISQVYKVALHGDPTPPAVRLGRIAFNNAFASDTGNFACASCHPDGNNDQLLWRIGGACFFGSCSGNDEPRSTMPIRGLKNTLPLHWDGTLGDPFGGGNGAVGVNGSGGTDCVLGDADGDHDCFLDLVNVALAGVMCDQTTGCPSGGNQLSTEERDNMATFLANVWYPPARSRRIDDTVSTPASPVPVPNGDGTPSSLNASALAGFQDFYTDQGGNTTNPDTCADSNAGCHELPLGASTNSATLNGFDAPTMRGMTDRFLQFSLGVTDPRLTLELANSGISLLGVSGLETPIRWDPNQGQREITTFGVAFLIFQPVYNVRPLNLFQMFEEASTGFSGAQGRQVELNTRTTTGGNLTGTDTELGALELSDSRGLVNLQGSGLRNGSPITLSFRSDGTYKNDDNSLSLTRSQLESEAQGGTLLITLTASLRSGWGSVPQPLLAPNTTDTNGVTGDPPIPVIPAANASNPGPFTLTGTDVNSTAGMFLDGAPLTATLSCSHPVTTDMCDDGNVTIDINQSLALGLHLLQVQNPAGPLSEEMPICVGAKANCN